MLFRPPAGIDPMTRGARRLLLFGLQTVLGVTRRGFFIPYVRADSIAPPGPVGWVEARFEAALPTFVAVMDDIDGLAPALNAIGGESPPEPCWDQDWFPPYRCRRALCTHVPTPTAPCCRGVNRRLKLTPVEVVPVVNRRAPRGSA